ncbi:MAG: hypothetical protein SOI24_10905 [Coriobacteriales bacterium]
MRDHLANTLMELCESKRLADITMTDVIRRAKVAKQTFYNHFADVNDLICYAASKPLIAGAFPGSENSLQALKESLRHPDFFCQLGTLRGQNNYWGSYQRWCRDYFLELCGLADTAAQRDEKGQLGALSIELWVGGTVEMLKAWYSRRMPEPAEVVMRAISNATPRVVADNMRKARPVAEGDYPR